MQSFQQQRGKYVKYFWIIFPQQFWIWWNIWIYSVWMLGDISLKFKNMWCDVKEYLAPLTLHCASVPYQSLLPIPITNHPIIYASPIWGWVIGKIGKQKSLVAFVPSGH